jgi:hypothetical protein
MISHDRHTEIGKIVARVLTTAAALECISAAEERASAILRSDSSKLAGTVLLALDGLSMELPSELKSCRLSVMRGGAAYHVERHPNATQYVYSLRNCGTISVFDGTTWTTSELNDDLAAPLARRWHAVPENTWHQPIPGEKDWTVLGFHTILSSVLIDDYGFEGPRRAT